jgi:tetratricopeptide (TPR) repeat protein
MDARRQSRVTDTTALQPPGQTHAATAGASDNNRWWWIALAGLLLLGLAVIFALPGLVGPAHEATAPAQPPPPAGDDTAALRDTAHQTLQAYLKLRARLELDNAGAWGEPNWSEAAARASAADRYFAQRQFAAAVRDYQAALDHLQQLDASRSDILAAALEAAARALTANDVDTAMSQFQAALAIEPDHPAATRGLAQASSRRAVLEQMNRARAAETNSDLEAALAAYRQATQLDAAYEPASVALQRVTGLINARDFSAAMTRALAALDAGQTGAAGKALADAGRLQPGNTAVRDARRRLQGMRAQAGLNSLRRQASGKVASEDWQAATELYRKALAIDASAGFASEGLRRAEERSALHAQFDHYLDTPARIYSAVPLANAGKLLAAASEAPPDEPRLAGKITALRELVTGASVPITVTLNSDGVTSVVIHRVGRLGQFNSHQLELLPGDYTIVGNRPGYRDVRKAIKLRPGMSLPPLVVRCEEKI